MLISNNKKIPVEDAKISLYFREFFMKYSDNQSLKLLLYLPSISSCQSCTILEISFYFDDKVLNTSKYSKAFTKTYLRNKIMNPGRARKVNKMMIKF